MARRAPRELRSEGLVEPRTTSMSSFQYVWLIWSGTFLAAFLVIYILSARYRSTMLVVGLATMPLGLTERLFVPEYWNPPSLFDLAQRSGFDIESLIFAFSIGGIAAVLYSLIARRSSLPVVTTGRHRLHRLALATPALVFLILAFIGWNPIYPALIAMAAGAGAAVLCRPDLATRTVVGGLLFLVLYALFMLGLVFAVPGFIEQVWNLPALSSLLIAGVPLEELLFGFAFGLYWANVYEHLSGTKPMAVPMRHHHQPGTAAERFSASRDGESRD